MEVATRLLVACSQIASSGHSRGEAVGLWASYAHTQARLDARILLICELDARILLVYGLFCFEYPHIFFFFYTSHGIPAGLLGACEILKNSIMKAFFRFMLAACLMGK